MDFQTLDLASLSALADIHARRLALRAESDNELRDALQTTASANGVRIGRCEITYRVVHGERVFDIRHEDDVINGIVFYETARKLVARLNNGMSVQHPEFKQLVQTNAEYARARDGAYQHAEQARRFNEIGDEFRADLAEHKYSRYSARARFLRDRLLCGDHYVY